MTTMLQFANRHGITIRNEWTDHNENMDPDNNRNMTHWKSTLYRYENGSRKQMTVTFSMGFAHTSEPKADQVLECLASDAASIENADTFEDWAGELYNLDDLLYQEAKRLQRTYNASKRQTDKLRHFLGDLYDTAVWEVEPS